MQLFSQEMTTHLAELGSQLHSAHQANDPFPHIVINDFLPREPVEAALADYPGPDALPGIRFNKEREQELAFNDVARVPAALREILFFMNSAPVLQFLERLTGIAGLLPAPFVARGSLDQIRPGEKPSLFARAGRVAKQLSSPILTNLVRRIRSRQIQREGAAPMCAAAQSRLTTRRFLRPGGVAAPPRLARPCPLP